MQHILIINAHQRYEGVSEGRLNATLVQEAKDLFESKGCTVRTTIIDTGYDVQAEVEKHTWADLIILQTPVYWFSTPWIHKKYVDEVFNAGLFTKKMAEGDGRTRSDPARQYGSGGLLQGKHFMLSTTWNAPAESFGDPSQTLFHGKRPSDVLAWTGLNYRFCGAEVLPDFSCFDVIKNPRIAADLERYEQHLEDIYRRL